VAEGGTSNSVGIVERSLERPIENKSIVLYNVTTYIRTLPRIRADGHLSFSASTVAYCSKVNYRLREKRIAAANVPLPIRRSFQENGLACGLSGKRIHYVIRMIRNAYQPFKSVSIVEIGLLGMIAKNIIVQRIAGLSGDK
jgi:hypothetical protein